MKEKKQDPVIATNREARRDYFILDTLEAGIMLAGCEVKSLRESKASLSGSFARLDGNEVFLYNLYIAPYAMGNRENLEPLRERKLYFNDRGMAKVELAVVKGKKAHDKRSDIKKHAVSREIDRAIKNRNRK